MATRSPTEAADENDERDRWVGRCGRTAAALAGLIVGLLAARLPALDLVTFERDGRRATLAGRIEATASDGRLLVCEPNGACTVVTAAELVSRERDGRPFAPLSREAFGQKLLAELPAGFAVLPQKVKGNGQFVVCHNTPPAYAEWCHFLIEDLNLQLGRLCENLGVPLHEPEFPLAAIVFADRASYTEYARRELGEATRAVLGYYSLATNRIVTFDMTGASRRARPNAPVRSIASLVAERPEAERTTATLLHEATHQLAYNRGLQRRFSDPPAWLSEGLALFFETPNFSDSGRAKKGGDNPVNRANFLAYLPRRPADSLTTLLRDDARFRDSATAPEAYAEAWALTLFLFERQREPFAAFLTAHARRPPLSAVSPDERLAEFRRAFGADVERRLIEMFRRK